MGFLKEAGESFLNFSERVLDKTEQLAQIARITMEIKKLEHTIKELYLQIGEYVYESISSNNAISENDQFLQSKTETINELKMKIQQKQNEIQQIKQKYDSKYHRF